MAFKRFKGKTKVIYLPVKVSQAFTAGAIVSIGTGGDAGTVIPATSSTTALSHIGVIVKDIASTDSDYATARKVPIEVPVERNVEWLGDVTSGLVAADIGLEVDLTDSLTINRGATSVKVAMVTGVISTTKGLFDIKFKASY